MSSAPCPSCGTTLASTARFCSRCGSATGFVPPSAVDHRTIYQPGGNQQTYQPPAHQSNIGPQPIYQPPDQHLDYQQPPYQQQPYGYGYAVAPMPPVYAIERKDKTAAVLLAVFLGLWTWVYTYRKDAWKFWLSFGLHLTLFNPLWTWMIIFLPNFALHIWAIIDTAAKPQQFYDYYPNG